VPQSEDALDNCTFGELQDWQDFVSESVDADEDDDSEQEFDDMGSEAPTHEDEDADAEFAEKYLDISGVNFD
jgi:hypothetical protein